jgi:hypothetical protein
MTAAPGMRLAIALAALGAACMAVLIGDALLEGHFGPEGSILFALAWGKVTLADLYVGFGLFSAWVLFRERHTARALGFVLLVLTLGNLFTCLYVLVALVRSQGSWPRFWLGHRHELAPRLA